MTPDIKILCLGQSNMQGSGGNTGYTPAKVNVLVHDGSEWVHCEDPYDPQGLKSMVPAIGNYNLILFTQNKLPASFSFRSGFGY